MILIFSIFVFILLSLYLFSWLYKKKNNDEVKYDLDEITVIIPFRNEEKNLPKLLKSIEKLNLKPKEFIFVNDHSEDKSLNLLKSLFYASILSMEFNENGKKEAIHKGVLASKTKFILTWDADIEVTANYFQELKIINTVDLLILPVKMKSNSFFGIFASLDYYFLNAISFACGKFYKNIVASGANLLFKKDLYLNYYSNAKNKHISSGDDVFLLKHANDNKYIVESILNNKLAVKTFAPINFREFFHQRLRWIGKSKRVGDNFTAIIGFFGLVYHILFWLIFFQNLNLSVILFLSKILIEIPIFLPYLIKLKHEKLLLFTAVYTLIYPIYFIFIIFTLFFVKVEWKNRKIVS
jgi:poly-beta-1,6-N-acetyl-D-glucosamine synthase